MFFISFPENIVYENFRIPSIYPATLPQQETAGSIKIIFAALVVSKNKNYARLPGIRVEPQKNEQN